jgi:hypothetical protein
MVAYINNRFCVYKSWKQAVKKKQKLILGPQYKNALHDECMLAMVYGHNGPLLEKILTLSHPSEFEYVIDLFASEIDITFNNGNLVISN